MSKNLKGLGLLSLCYALFFFCIFIVISPFILNQNRNFHELTLSSAKVEAAKLKFADPQEITCFAPYPPGSSSDTGLIVCETSAANGIKQIIFLYDQGKLLPYLPPSN